MGCFFGCFRFKDSRSNLITPPEPVVSRSRNALSSLFQCDDESLGQGEEGRNPLPKELGVAELKDEAKFLKACGTLPQTPIEIRKASEKWQDIPARIGEEKSSKLISWLPNASIEKLKLEKQSDESPRPVKIHEESLTGLGYSLDSPSSCLTDGHMGRVSSSSIQRRDIQNVFTALEVRDSETHSETSSISPGFFAPSVQCKNKSVRFDSESDRSAFSSKGSSSEGASQHSKQPRFVGSRSVTKPSPYPTPLKLTDEMQTPGTVFPAYMNDIGGEKVIKVRSQYVHPVLDPVKNPSQWNELKDENSDSQHHRESLKQNDELNLMSTPTSKLAVEHLSVGEEMKNEASLSSWLKPPSAKQDGNNKQFGSVSGEKGYLRRTPADRPILGMVAAHWNDDEESHVSPKWWDGNGIPNSTNKYKEDQKVSWHATPFEERLEKALSEETFISQRKPVSKTPPVDFSESEESDTALSHLQSPAHFKSVVSF
ncbi:protein JASON isoform X1 [Sesamum indicum]|uniref:Protein JASON isoform X1 n=1 Tax=Sesamum indicum TaxID=4182 RepID=A0A6I9UGC2_SESIN|nr:protein JASON isoform X1 [Sesamum indicum]